MTLKSLYSKMLINICENKYAEADNLLNIILTEKVKSRVKKAVKKCCGKPECENTKKVVKESQDTVKLKIKKNAALGEWVVAVYINGEYNEEHSYFTDSKSDAIATRKKMANYYKANNFLLKESNMVLTEALNEKGIYTIKSWCEKLGCREAGKKLIDYVLNKKIGLSSDDLPDTATFMNGLDGVEDLLNDGEYQKAYDIAKDTALEMLEDEDF